MAYDHLHPSADVPLDVDLAARLAELTTFINEKLENLRREFGVETLLVVTRGTLEQPQFARAQASRKASRFLRDVMRTDAGQLAEKLEGYVVSGAGDHGAISSSSMNISKMKQKEQIKIARDFILNGLIDALREENVPEDQIPKSMNYKSYETKIVDQCGVVLVGFPGDKGIVNPGELDAVMLKELLCRLNDGRCHWQSLNKSVSDPRNQATAFPRGGSSDGSCPELRTHFPGASFFPQTPPPSASDASQSPSHLPDVLPVVGTPLSSDDMRVMSEYDDKEMKDDAHCAIAQPPPPSEPMNWQPDQSFSKAMDVLQRAYFSACLSLLGNEHPNSNVLPPTPSMAAQPFQFASLCQPQPSHHPHATLNAMSNNYPNTPSDSFTYSPQSTGSCHRGRPASRTSFTDVGLHSFSPEHQPAIQVHGSLPSAFPDNCIDIDDRGIWPYIDWNLTTTS